MSKKRATQRNFWDYHEKKPQEKKRKKIETIPWDGKEQELSLNILEVYEKKNKKIHAYLSTQWGETLFFFQALDLNELRKKLQWCFLIPRTIKIEIGISHFTSPAWQKDDCDLWIRIKTRNGNGGKSKKNKNSKVTAYLNGRDGMTINFCEASTKTGVKKEIRKIKITPASLDIKDTDTYCNRI